MSVVVRFDGVVPADSPGAWPGPLSLEVPDGRFAVVYAAPALAGTLLRLCTGQLAPEAGRVEVLGVAPASLSRRAGLRFRRRLGVAFDPPALVSNLTLLMNLVVPMLYGGMARRGDAAARAARLLESAGLGPWAGRRPADVPPDIRREASVLRAISVEPDLLLLEHPTGSLRPERAAALIERCRMAAPTVVVGTPERDPALDAAADLAHGWDEHGLRYVNDEVGIG